MTKEELKEIFDLLEAAGWQPMLCDTPIPVYESLHCGNPADPGQVPPDMILIPKALFSSGPEMMVRVMGDSMIDVGIEDGDCVKMKLGASPRDGDVVVVAIGSECTAKAYFEDDDGTKWLVPQNNAEKDKYKVIRLGEDLDPVYLCGVVTDVLKSLPRVPGRAMRCFVKEARANYVEKPRISSLRIDDVIRIMSKDIQIARHWYSVCRSMMDEQLYGDMEYDMFCQRVAKAVPNHKHLPRPDDMQRMAVASFTKPVRRWDERNAPVKGKRFRVYKELAERTAQLLTMNEDEFQLFT